MTDEPRRTRVRLVKNNIGQPPVELSLADAARAKLEEILTSHDPNQLLIAWDNGEQVLWASIPESSAFEVGVAIAMDTTLVSKPIIIAE